MAEIRQKICCPSLVQTKAALAILRKSWERVWAGFATGIGGEEKAFPGQNASRKGPDGAVRQVRVKPS